MKLYQGRIKLTTANIIIVDPHWILYPGDASEETRILHYHILDPYGKYLKTLSHEELLAEHPKEIKEYLSQNDPKLIAILNESLKETTRQPNLKAKAKNFHVHTTMETSNTPTYDTIIVDGRSDTCRIDSEAWIINYTTNKKVDVTGFDRSKQTQEVTIGGAITTHDLPDGTTILLKVNEASLLGKNACSLLSIAQMRENNVEIEEKPTDIRDSHTSKWMDILSP